jgi:transcriptional regulator with XRE-family HTH domain
VNIGENIKKYRLKAGLSREKLMLKCQGSFSTSHLLAVEKGRTKNPGIEMVSAIAEALNLSVDELLGRKPAKRP